MNRFKPNITHRKAVTALSIVFLVVVGIALSTQPNEEHSKVDWIEKQIGAGNLGSHTFYHVYLDNGSRITYEKYESHHPLCPEDPEKCGEDSEDPGFSSIKNLTESSQFKKKGNIFEPQDSVCMASKSSFTEC